MTMCSVCWCSFPQAHLTASAELRTRKARAEAQAENGTLDPLLVATEAHIYYNKVMCRVEKRPKKTLEYKLYPSLGMYYLCFWKDEGYADQDVV